MKKLKIKWLVWTGKVLSSMVAMLGMSSCFFQPSMYGFMGDFKSSLETQNGIRPFTIRYFSNCSPLLCYYRSL